MAGRQWPGIVQKEVSEKANVSHAVCNVRSRSIVNDGAELIEKWVTVIGTG